MIVEAFVVAGALALGCVIGRFHASLECSDDLAEAQADRDLANADAAEAQAERDRYAIDLGHAGIALDAAQAKASTLTIELAGAREHCLRLRGKVAFWSGAFEAAQIVLDALEAAPSQHGADAPPTDPSEPHQ